MKFRSAFVPRLRVLEYVHPKGCSYDRFSLFSLRSPHASSQRLFATRRQRLGSDASTNIEVEIMSFPTFLFAILFMSVVFLMTGVRTYVNGTR